MFRPMRMDVLTIICLKTDWPAVSREIVRAGCLQVERVSDPAESQRALNQVEAEELLNRAGELARRVEALSDNLQLKAEFAESALQIGELRELLDALEESVTQLEKKVESVTGRIRRLEKTVKELDILSWEISGLEDRGVSFKWLMGVKFLHRELGALPVGTVRRVAESLQSMPHELLVLQNLGNSALVLALASEKNKNHLQNSLRGGHFAPTPIPRKYTLAPESAAESIEVDQWQAREALAEARAEFKRVAAENAAAVASWRRNLHVAARILRSMGNFLQTERCYYFAGWSPHAAVPALLERIRATAKARVEISATPADESGDMANGTPVPTKLSTPRFLKPFRRLVSLYGVPPYNALDPTPALAVTFVLMFGFMFGDVGHGLTLALAGMTMAFLRPKGSALRDYGFIFLSCGLSGAAFGFLFGSIFGMENLIQPLWMRPLHAPGKLLAYGLIIGVASISLGILSNIVQCLLSRRFRDAFFGQWGLCSILFYWMSVGVLLLAVGGKKLAVSWPLAVGLLLVPLLAMALGETILRRLEKRKGETELAELIFRPAEVMLSLVTNTFSYTRIPAFAMNHAALLATNMLISNIAGGGNSALAATVAIQGNIFIIALEGLIVFIQCMRLEYYEFFSKFFMEQGRKFQPLTAD